MAFIPPTPLALHGGCFCSAIRYTISIPAVEDRPLFPNAAPVPTHPDCYVNPAHSSASTSASPKNLIPTRFPIMEFDHCQSCRRARGSLIEAWLICQLEWVAFKLLPRDNSLGSTGHVSAEKQQTALKIFPTKDVVYPGTELKQQTYIGGYSSNGESQRTFCMRCGTPLTFHYSGDRGGLWDLGPLVDIGLGTLDKESIEVDGVRPERHGWWADGIEWIKEFMYKGSGVLVRHPTGRPRDVIAEDEHLIEGTKEAKG